MDCHSVNRRPLTQAALHALSAISDGAPMRGPVVEPAVDDLDAGKDTFHGGGDFLARARRGCRGQIAGHLEGEFGLHNAHEELRRFDAGRTFKKERRKQPAGEGRVHIQLTLRGDVGTGDLVPDYTAAVMGKQPVDQTVLDGVSVVRRSRTDRRGEFG